MSYTTLMILAIVLAAFCATLAFVLVRVLREERRRSEARVAMLAAMAAVTEYEEPGVEYDFGPELLDRGGPLGSSDLFAVRESRSQWPGRLAVAGAMVAVVLTGAVALRESRTATKTNAAVNAVPPPVSTLELLSLEHAEGRDSLTIRGRVHNPAQGAAISDVAVTALLFAPDGTLLANGRAPLDLAALPPGGESAFTIAVPVSAQVARYRIGFRGTDGRTIGHVDKRSPQNIARGPS
jgi:hypothetical protein